MIYIFKNQNDNKCSIVYRGDMLNEEQKSKAIKVVAQLPLQNTPENHYASLEYNPNTNDVEWVYYENPLVVVEEVEESV
jgi:hypothetical protein